MKLADIISNHTVLTQIECSFNCLSEEECIGFKYKSDTNSETVNCQLSRSEGMFDVVNEDDEDWQFFIDIFNISVSMS